MEICSSWDEESHSLKTIVIQDDIEPMPLTAETLEDADVYEFAGDTFTDYGLACVRDEWNALNTFNHTITVDELKRLVQVLQIDDYADSVNCVIDTFVCEIQNAPEDILPEWALDALSRM